MIKITETETVMEDESIVCDCTAYGPDGERVTTCFVVSRRELTLDHDKRTAVIDMKRGKAHASITEKVAELIENAARPPAPTLVPDPQPPVLVPVEHSIARNKDESNDDFAARIASESGRFPYDLEEWAEAYTYTTHVAKNAE